MADSPWPDSGLTGGRTDAAACYPPNPRFWGEGEPSGAGAPRIGGSLRGRRPGRSSDIFGAVPGAAASGAEALPWPRQRRLRVLPAGMCWLPPGRSCLARCLRSCGPRACRPCPERCSAACHRGQQAPARPRFEPHHVPQDHRFPHGGPAARGRDLRRLDPPAGAHPARGGAAGLVHPRHHVRGGGARQPCRPRPVRRRRVVRPQQLALLEPSRRHPRDRHARQRDHGRPRTHARPSVHD